MERLREIIEVFKDLKEKFIYVSDQTLYGENDRWVLPDFTEEFEGDCEDFALAVRKKLDNLNIQSRLAYCITETRQAHLVCVVGNCVIDNRFDILNSKDDLEEFGYSFIAVSGHERGDPWRMLRKVSSLKPYELYCPICERIIVACNREDVVYGKATGYVFVHDDIDHEQNDLEALANKIN